jgi:alkanesulfonate monooxygenase SsuD/methylene tetrahydromethanopterin reductase-like flavin-dependent oxidoreductase (luciferase family)
VGLDHVWAPDHLVFHRPILETITTLAAVAGATRRVGLGTAVLNGVLRAPVWLAKQLSTLVALAPGRLALGIGVGGEYPPEFEAAGVPLERRGRRLDEVLDLLPRLMGGAEVRFTGETEVRCEGLAPAADPLPPILVGGRSDVALRRAARAGDAWLPMWMDAATVAEKHELVAAMAAEHGRPRPDIALVAFVNVTDDRAAGREEAAQLIQRQYGMPFDRVERWALIGGVDEVAEGLAAYRDAGVTGFALSVATPRHHEQLERLAAVREALGRTEVAP